VLGLSYGYIILQRANRVKTAAFASVADESVIPGFITEDLNIKSSVTESLVLVLSILFFRKG